MNVKIYTLDEIRSIARPIAQRYGIAGLYLFGSYARGEATPQSDIDFRVDRGNIVDMLELGGLYSDLEDSFQKPINVLTTQMLSHEFLNSISSDEILIYEHTLSMEEIYQKLQKAENELKDRKMTDGKAAFASLRAEYE